MTTVHIYPPRYKGGVSRITVEANGAESPVFNASRHCTDSDTLEMAKIYQRINTKFGIVPTIADHRKKAVIK